MQPHYILTADDYGPVEFINAGIRDLVKKGKINSVQVLANGPDPNQLNDAILDLACAVPLNKRLDVGIHITLTSGQPLMFRNDPDQMRREWKSLVRKSRKFSTKAVPHHCFKKYSKFEFDYLGIRTDTGPRDTRNQAKEDLLMQEFHAQTDALQNAIDAAHQSLRYTVLDLTCVSNHHNVIYLSPEFFRVYAQFARDRGLAMRAPRVIPVKTSRNYASLAVQLTNTNINQDTGARMKKTYRDFETYKFNGVDDQAVKSPYFSDTRMYRDLGSLFVKRQLPDKLLHSTRQKFYEMARRSKKAEPQFNNIINGTRIVEFVFHVGGPALLHKKTYEAQVDHYPGVSHKYFDNRVAELRALDGVQSDGTYAYVFDNLTSWAQCPDIMYRS